MEQEIQPQRITSSNNEQLIIIVIIVLVAAFIIGSAPSLPKSSSLRSPINQSAVKSIPVNKTFSSDAIIIKVSRPKPIYHLAVSGKVTLNSPTSYARVILDDAPGNEYLVYEAQGPFDSGTLSFDKACQETCTLDKIIPKSVKTELSDAKITIDKIYVLKDKKHGFKKEVKRIGPKAYQEKLNRLREEEKIAKINQYIKSHHLKWTAGKTSVSELTYQQKKELLGGFGPTPKKKVNLKGFEYYKGGIFELPGSKKIPRASSDFPSSFDWRNRHGENWMTPVRVQWYQGHYCGCCWAFGAVGATEAVTNLYFNQHLNLDLSEQDLLSCVPTLLRPLGFGGCRGDYPYNALKYIKNTGVTTESCFPWRAMEVPCKNKPTYCKNSVLKITDVLTNQEEYQPGSPLRANTPVNEREVKIRLANYGPLATDIIKLNHAMTLVGWETDPSDNRPVWIIKNSWGKNWGENGYARIKMLLDSNLGIHTIIPPITISDRPYLKIRCVDKDNDGYCNWGISETMPSTCPSFCKPKEDCDDSNPNLGPYDAHFNCIPLH